MRAAFLLLPLALAACAGPISFDDMGNGPAPAVAPAPVQPPEVRLVSAIEQRGCVLTADNQSAILLAANVTQAELIDMVPRLNAAGRMEVAGEGAIRVLTERCV